jgi:hypothetical protein
MWNDLRKPKMDSKKSKLSSDALVCKHTRKNNRNTEFARSDVCGFGPFVEKQWYKK